MHDAILGEGLGLPSVGVLTRAFVSAGDMMARVLGAEGYRFVAIDHPISSASADELAQRARVAAAQSRTLLVV